MTQTIAANELMGAGARTMTAAATGMLTFQRKFQIITNDRYIGQYQIFQWLLAPGSNDTTGHPLGLKLGKMYDTGRSGEKYENCYLSDIKLDETTEDGLQWVANCTYSPWDPSVLGQINPLNAIPQQSVTTATHQEPVYFVYEYDAQGNVVQDNFGYPKIIPVVNSAGTWFPTGVARDVSLPILRITRNEQNINVPFFESIINCVNLDQFPLTTPHPYPIKTARFTNYEISWQFHPIIGVYYTVQYQYAINYNTHIKYVIDMGTSSKDPSQGDRVVHNYYATGYRQLVTDPQYLDGTGHLLQPDPQTGIKPPPVIGAFEIYQPISFELAFGFNIPLPRVITMPPWYYP